MACIHLQLHKLNDTQWKDFPSFEEGYRFYVCANADCKLIFKVKTIEPHTVKNQSSTSSTNEQS